MTESALCSRQRICAVVMCQECEDLQEQISRYRKFLQQSFDVLTLDRIKELIADLEREKNTKHASGLA